MQNKNKSNAIFYNIWIEPETGQIMAIYENCDTTSTEWKKRGYVKYTLIDPEFAISRGHKVIFEDKEIVDTVPIDNSIQQVLAPHDYTKNIVLEKLLDPKMRELIAEYMEKFEVLIPPEYTVIFKKSRKLYAKNEGPYSEVKNNTDSRYNDPKGLFNWINEVEYKYEAIYYHLQNAIYLQKLIKEHIKHTNDMLKELDIQTRLWGARKAGKIVFEYEAFILQCKACLERFIISVSYYLGFHAYKIERLKNKLKELSPKNVKAQNIINIIKQSRKFYYLLESRENISDRTKIAHGGQVPLKPLNTIFDPHSGTIIFPMARYEKGAEKTKSTPIIELMESTMQDLFGFIDEIYDVIFQD